MAIWLLLYIKEEWCESRFERAGMALFLIAKIRRLSKLIFHSILIVINKISFLYFCRFHVYRQNIPRIKLLCEIADFSNNFELLHFQFHRWLYKTVTGMFK